MINKSLFWTLYLLLLVATIALCVVSSVQGATLPPLSATVVSVDGSSAVVQVTTPVMGAADYRFRAGRTVKYFGVDPVTGAPQLRGEINAMFAKRPVKVVVEAVDCVGPAPYTQLYDPSTNAQLYPPPTMPPVAGMTAMTAALPGDNEGPSYDGLTTINGQGDIHNTPHVLAVSPVLSIQASGAVPVPSAVGATQVVSSGFNSGTITPVGTVDPAAGNEQFLITAGNGTLWDVFCRQVDTIHSHVQITDRHYMATVFDGGTPGANVPLHQAHGVISLSPQPTLDFSGGRVLHMTAEVDATVDGRRWVAFNVSPYDDPLQNWYTSNGGLNNRNQALYVQVFDGHYTVDVFNGPLGIASTPLDTPVAGALGQAPIWAPRTKNGNGIDCRSRFDLYLSQTHVRFLEDGAVAVDADLPPGGLPFTKAKCYFSNYLYHSAQLDTNQLNGVTVPYWANVVPYSSESHWDNIAAEVLPAMPAL